MGNIQNLSLICVLLYASFWLIVSIRQYRRNSSLSASSVLYMSYFLFAILAVILYTNPRLGLEHEELSLFPFIYLAAMLMMGSSTLRQYDNKAYTAIQVPNKSLVMALIYLYVFLSIIIIPSVISHMGEGLTMLILDQDGGANLYNDAKVSYVASDRKISNLPAIIYGLLSDFGIFLFFYYLTLKNRKKLIMILFFLSIAVKMIEPLSRGGRTGVTMSALTILITYFLFKPFIDQKTRSIVRKLGVLVFVLVAVPFALLTISRFGSTEESSLDSVIYYAGQAPLNFDKYCLDAGGIRYGDRTCPEFKRLLGFSNVPIDIDTRRAKYSYLKIDDDVFYTYVGDFVLDFGPFIAFLLFAVFSMVFLNATKCKGHIMPFHKLILVFFCACVCIQGGMYLFNYSHMGNYQMLMIFLLYFVFRFDYANSSIARVKVDEKYQG